MRRSLTLAVLVLLSSQATVNAAVVRVWPKLGAVLNADFTPVDPSFIISGNPYAPILAPRAEKYVVQVDVLMRIDDLQANQLGFGGAGFYIPLASSPENNADLPGWNLDISQLRIGPHSLVEKWHQECDCGLPPPGVIWGILQNAGYRRDGDPRRLLGMPPFQNGPDSPHHDGEFAGSVYFDLPGPNPVGRVDIVDVAASIFDSQFNSTTQGVSGEGGSLTFGVPEPSTWTLLGLGSGMLFLARRVSKRPQLGSRMRIKPTAVTAFEQSSSCAKWHVPSEAWS